MALNEANKTFFNVVNMTENSLYGYCLNADHDQNSIHADKLWTITFPPIEKLSDVVRRPDNEQIQSATRLMEHGSNKIPLGKYLNHNVLLITTTIDPKNLQALNFNHDTDPSIAVYLVDVITGSFLLKRIHTNSKGPVVAAL